MNQFLKWAEPKFAILAVVLFTGALGIASYSNPSFQIARGIGGAVGGYTPSPVEPLIKLLRYGIYLATVLLLIARFKSVVRPVARDPFLWGLVGLVVISFIWSDFPSISQKEGMLTLMNTLFGVYLASRYSLKEQLKIVAWGAGITAVFSFLYTLAFPGSGIEQGIHAGAWRGPLMQKNLFSRLVAMCALPLLLVAFKYGKQRVWLWGVFGVAFGLIILSTSKTALVIFLTLLMLVPLYRALQSSNSAMVPLVIVLILMAASGATWLVTNWASFLASLGKDATLTGRTYIWEFVMDSIQQRPWFGYGYYGFWQPGGEGENVKYYVRLTLTQAHNGYLDTAVQLGLFGFSFFILSLITSYIRAIIWARLDRSVEHLWPIMYVTFLFMYNQTESTIIETNSIFWILYVSITLSMKYVAVQHQTLAAEEEYKQLGLLEQN